MHFRRVCLEAFGYTLPEEVVTTAEIERRLEPLYRRLRLPEGRLELMTGIRERRFFPPGTRPSTVSIESGSEGYHGKRHRSAVLRRAGARLGLPRLSGAGHRLPRASRPGPPRRSDDLRRVECLPRPTHGHDPDCQHDRAGTDSRGHRRRHRIGPRPGREHDCPAQRRRVAHPQLDQGFDRLAHDRLGQRGDRACATRS